MELGQLIWQETAQETLKEAWVRLFNEPLCLVKSLLIEEFAEYTLFAMPNYNVVKLHSSGRSEIYQRKCLYKLQNQQ